MKQPFFEKVIGPLLVKKNYAHFVEPEGSSPTTLQPKNFLSLKPDDSNPGPPIPIP